MNEDFWDDVLGHIRNQQLVTIVGPDLTVVNVDNAEQPLTRLIGWRLADRYGLTEPSGISTMDEAVALVLRARGRDELSRLYRVINDIIEDLDPVPGEPLRNLAAISDLRFFVSTTPDGLLAQAINDVRFHGSKGTRELAFSLTQSTSKQSQNAQEAKAADTVVVRLFGEASSTPQYAIHEEDRLEWLHTLMSDAAGLPDWLDRRIKQQPTLFVGCELPDWIGRFLLRLSSTMRLSDESKQFFFVGSPALREPTLSNFFATYFRNTQVQQLEMRPAEFVAKLRTRWEERTAGRAHTPVVQAGPPSPQTPRIFISYMREDADAARRLCTAVTGLGGDVWFDEQRLVPGDAWEEQILRGIRRTIRLFIPIISANTEQAYEGYVFKEWREAVERSRYFMSRRFIVPVIVDDDYDGDPGQYRQMPNDFAQYHFGRAPAGDPDGALLKTLTEEIRAMRRTGAM